MVNVSTSSTPVSQRVLIGPITRRYKGLAYSRLYQSIVDGNYKVYVETKDSKGKQVVNQVVIEKTGPEAGDYCDGDGCQAGSANPAATRKQAIRDALELAGVHEDQLEEVLTQIAHHHTNCPGWKGEATVTVK